MKKSELKQLIKEVIEESLPEDRAVLSDPSVRPLIRKLYDNTAKGRLCDEDDINAAIQAAYRVGIAKGTSGGTITEMDASAEWVVGAEGPKAWEQIVKAPDIVTAIKTAQKKQYSVQGPGGSGVPPTSAQLNIQ